MHVLWSHDTHGTEILDPLTYRGLFPFQTLLPMLAGGCFVNCCDSGHDDDDLQTLKDFPTTTLGWDLGSTRSH